MRENLLLEHVASFQPVLDEGQGCLVEAVPLARGAFSRESTDLILRPGVRVFVEETVEYRGPDPKLYEFLGLPEEGWRELFLPEPTDDLPMALEQVESLLAGAAPTGPAQDPVPPHREPGRSGELKGPEPGVDEDDLAEYRSAAAGHPAAPPPETPDLTDDREDSSSACRVSVATSARFFTVPPAIRGFVRDLTDLARQGELDPVVGREKETDSLLVVLGKRERPNAVLVGPPGVGKSAVAWRLASRLAEGAVPDFLAGAHLLELNCGNLVAGASFKGDVEGRVKRLMEACSDPRIILFVDEFHNLLEARGDVKVIEILKPALASGGLRVLGACTPKDYRAIEMDGTLARRFEKLVVGEPSREETVEILCGLRAALERHHGVRLPVGAIQEAVYLSEHFLPNRYQPDKAISLLDEALSRLRVRRSAAPERDMSEADLERELDRAIEAGDFARARRLHNELSQKKENPS